MNKMKFLHYMIVLFIFSAQFLSSVELESMSIPYAEAKLCVTIVDYDGRPVEQAKVRGSFHDGKSQWREIDEQLTDSNGYAEIKGMSWDFDIGVTVEKDGYYETSVDYSYLSRNPIKGAHMAHGKWFPYGKEEVIVLKKKCLPVPLVTFSGLEFSLPELDRQYGYDMEYGSFLEPIGDGKVADFYLMISFVDTATERRRILRISFPECMNGGYIAPLCPSSKFPSPYSAEERKDFQKEFTFESVSVRKEDGHFELPQKNILKGDQCLIFRSRTLLDETGKIISAHYGKIYGEFKFGISPSDFFADEVKLFFNPAENDANLEGDGLFHRELQKGKRRIDRGWR